MSMAESIAYNMDCLEYMRTLPDNYFDLCVADPPYGDAMQTDSVIDHLHSSARQQERERERERTQPWNRFGQRFDRYKYQLQEPAEHGRSATGKKLSRGT